MRLASAVLLVELPDVPMGEESLIEDSHDEMSSMLDGEKAGPGSLITFDDLESFMPGGEVEEPVGGL